jgi:peptidyl-prolyl cis-trans isomerase D
MFEFIRTHQRLMQFLLLLFIFPSFAFVGIQSYAHFGDGDDAVAKVAGKTITKQEWEAAIQQQMEQLRERFGAQFDAKVFDTPDTRQRILENLIAQRAMNAEVVRDHLSVSDQALQQAILAIPGMTTADGKFDVERYKSILAVQGMTPAMYEVRKRQDMAMQQLNSAIQETAIAPKSVAGRISDLNDQERLVQEIPFRNDAYMAQVKVTDDMIKAYYDKNIKQFEVPEQVKAEYVVLSSEALATQIPVSEADVRSYYDQNQKRFGVEEQRRASHILVAVKKDASAADVAAARAKAEKLLAQVKAAPGDFAKIAKANSDDPGSAERGGDLDVFGRGMMVKPFDDAAFKMKVGEISDLVKSDFGFHIIKLTEVKPATVKTVAEATPEITAEIRKQLAAKKYAESAEIFTNTAYEQSDSLKPLADKLKLPIQTADNLKRVPAPDALPTSPIANPKFLAALFSNDALKNKRNTEAVEVAPNTLVVGHVVEYKPVSRLPLEAVQSLVKARVTQTEAANLARRAGEAKLAELKKTPDGSAFGQEKAVSRTKENSIDPAAVGAIMKADTTKLPALVGVDLQGKGYSIYRINKVALPATVDAARRTAEQAQIANLLAQEEMLAFIDVLKQRAQVKILPAAASSRPAVDDRAADDRGADNAAAPAKPAK